MDFRTGCRVWAFMVYLLATALGRAAAADPETPPVEFHIEGGDATTTLTEFSRQARLQLLFDYNVVKGHTTKPLDGILQPAEALRRLLANSDLDFDFVNERTLAVMQKRLPPESTQPAVEPKPPRHPSRHAKIPKPTADGADGTEDIVRITGTFIRDEPPVGTELITVSRYDIQATGAATPADFLRTVPQIFGGGPNQDTYIGQEALTNSGLGVGVNLRGLGARATLVLVDGRRLAPSGSEGEFVDVENIPLSAIERIDLLPDSASAMYGADAVSGVINFILRSDLDGGETIARGGSGTRGDLQEYLFSQTLGKTWDGGSGLFSFEFYDRGALPAADRAYAVSDLRPFGGGNFDTYLTNPGNIFSLTPKGYQTWAIPTGQNGTHLAATDLMPGTVNLGNLYTNSQIIPSQRRFNLYLQGQQDLSDRVNVFTDVLLGHREATEQYSGVGAEILVPSTNPFYVNPNGATGPVLLAYNFGDDLGPTYVDVGVDTMNATLGLDFDMGVSWVLSAYANYAREKQNQVSGNQVDYTALQTFLDDPSTATAFNPFGDGSNTSAATLNAIRANYRLWVNSQLKTVDLKVRGPIGPVAHIPLQLTLGVDRREQEFSTAETATSSAPAMSASLSRRVISAFGELVAPLIDPSDGVPAVRKLEVSAAGRYENYTIFGGSAIPKLGAVWSPVQDLSLRGSWSRATRPPTLSDLDASHNQSLLAELPNPSPAAPGRQATVLVWEGKNAAVQPERARSWTAGLDYVSADLPGFSLGLTYFNTVFTNRIQATTAVANVLTDPAYAPIVTRNPSAAQIDNICNSTTFVQGNVKDCMSVPVMAIVDLRVRNLATLITNGIDFNAKYEHPARLGKLHFSLNGTWLRRFAEAVTPDAPLTELLNTQNEPVDLRMRATASWDHAGFGALVAADYLDSYRDTASVPQRRIASWTTIDLQLRYEFSDRSNSWLQGSRVVFNARNVFNVDPPFLNNQIVGLGYDQENATPYGRLLSLEIQKSW